MSSRIVTVSESGDSKTTSQQVTEPNTRNFISYTETKEIVHNISMIPDVITAVRLKVQYECENRTQVEIIFLIPMSKFFEDATIFKHNFNEVVADYLKKSTLYLKGTTQRERLEIHQAVELHEYTIIGLVEDCHGNITNKYIDTDTNDYIESHIRDATDEQGGFAHCEFIDFIVVFPVLSISDGTHAVSPYNQFYVGPKLTPTVQNRVTPVSHPPLQSKNHLSQSPHQGSALTGQSTTTRSFTYPVDDVSDPEEEPASSPPLNISAPRYDPNWRNGPTPTGPWMHNGIARQVRFDTSSKQAPNTTPPYPQAPRVVTPPSDTTYVPPHCPPYNAYSPTMTELPTHGPTQFQLSDYGIMTRSLYCSQLNRTTLDIKTFLKKDYVPIQGHGSLTNWYRRFTSHGLRCGVFIPPFESLMPLNTLGAWVPDLCDKITNDFPMMSQSIHTAIINFQAIPTGPDFTSILADTCGYTALHNLMRGVHPRLAMTPIIRHQPRCKPNESISEYVARWSEFVLMEHESGRDWRRPDVAQHILANLPSSQALWVQQHYDSLLLSQGHNFDVPPAFQMPMIARTISSLIAKNPHQSFSHHRSSHALAAVIHDGNDSLDDVPIDDDPNSMFHLHALHHDSTKICPLCQTTTHTLIDCHKYINHCLCMQYAKHNPHTIQEILAKHKHPPRLPSRTGPRSRSSTSHLLEAAPLSDPEEHSDHPHPEDLNVDIHPTGTSNSIRTYQLVEYNEDTDPPPPEDDIDAIIDSDPSCIRSVDFDFDVALALSPAVTTIHNATIVEQPHTVLPSDDPDTKNVAIGGQYDSGANMTTTHHLQLLWNVTKLDRPMCTLDAGQKRHVTYYRGYLVLPCTRDGVASYIAIATYYTPTIAVTLIAPSTIRDQYPYLESWHIGDTKHSASATFHDSKGTTILAFHLYTHEKLHYTAPFVRPTTTQRRLPLPYHLSMSITSSPFVDDTEACHDDMLYDDFPEFVADPVPLPTDTSPDGGTDTSPVFQVHPLHSRTQYQLWHQRLGHIQPRTVTDLHKHVDGIPHLTTPTLLDNCPICITSKMRRAGSSSSESRPATVCHQSLSIDMAFIVQKSKNSDRYIDNVGLKGETCYVLIHDYYSGMVHGKTLVNKGPPIEYFNQWLARFSPDIPNKTVRFDQGGEVGRCRRVIKLFQDFGYTIQLTGADSSHQNGSVERSHQTIGNMIRSLLHGAALPRKFWPYAFYHTLFLMNRIPHGTKPSPPITMCSGRRITLDALRVFGCRVYVRLPGERKAKLDTHTIPGIFLGYNETMKNIYWYDPNSHLIKTASHVRFDEGMADVPDPPPNVQLLQRVEHHNIMPDAQELTIDPVDFQLDSSPFRTIDTIRIDILCDDPTFGFVTGECHLRHRAYVSSISPHTSASHVRNIRHKYTGAYIVQIHNTPIFDLADATACFATIRNDPSIQHFDILLAPDKYVAIRDRREPLRINAIQLRAITDIRLMSPLRLHSIAALPDPLRPHDVPITPDELRIKDRLTRHQLIKLSTWPHWRAAEHKQLDAHHAQDMFGPPILPPTDAIILHPHWRYKIKSDGSRQARECCDGSPRAAPELHQDVVTYASCIKLPCMRLFFSIAAITNHFVLLTDAVNAYANARGPTIPTYIRVDDAYSDWYHTRFGNHIPRGMVVQAKHALQGHPEAGKLFEELANDILINRLGLTTTSHERNLYCGYFQTHKVYVCRQVDDLAIAAPSIAVGQAFIAAIGTHVTLAGNSLLTRFNGVQVEQASNYIRIHCEDYIDRFLERHGWSTPSATESITIKEPMLAPVYKQLDKDTGPPEHSPEGLQLARAAGFQYRPLLGILLYAYVICRLDIGYALTKLAQYSAAPAAIHFSALKHIALYLRSTKVWGIMYWRPTILSSLPIGSILALPTPDDPTLPPFPTNHSPSQLVAYVDAAHATDNARRSVTGYVLSFCAGAICYRSKVQASTAISSTEAELVASVLCAKTVKYIRLVLSELDFPQLDATPIYEDNAASILIVNASKPTPRTRHIDIQFFAIQEWKLLGHIVLLTIAGVINIADALTKALGWVLHHRHVRRSMGHHACQFKSPSPSL